MNSNPLVSVVILTYNRRDFVIKAILSALGQTYQNLEIIVVDDGSSDGSDEAVRLMAQKYSNIFFTRNERNIGFVKNLNKGISLTKGKYIARLDDDDIWINAKKIEKQVGFLEKNPEYCLVGGGVVVVGKKGDEITRYLLPENDQDIRSALLVDNVFTHSAVVFKKESYLLAGMYDEAFGFFADWALWLELGKLGKLYNFQEFFIQYLDQEGNQINSNRDYQIRRKLRAKIALNRKYRDCYRGSTKALMLSLASYVYSFIPYRKNLWPAIFSVRKLIFGHPPYRYSNKNEEK